MNGKPDTPIAIKSLDYREIAKPLTFRMIKEDLDACYTAGSPEPEKIILWEHQMDWLVKAERKGEPLEDLNVNWDAFSTGKLTGLAALCHVPRPAIWGIPVEYHCPLIERAFRDSIEIGFHYKIRDPELWQRLFGSGRIKRD